MTVKTTKCKYCGVEFSYTGRTRIFCSDKCCSKWHSGNNKTDKQPKNCIICGVEFIPWNGRQITCGSTECKNAQNKRWKAERRAVRIPYNYRKPENERKPICKKKRYTKAEWAKLSPLQRWEVMTWQEVSTELARLGIQYGEAQTLKEQGKLPDDFGKGVR